MRSANVEAATIVVLSFLEKGKSSVLVVMGVACSINDKNKKKNDALAFGLTRVFFFVRKAEAKAKTEKRTNHIIHKGMVCQQQPSE